MTYVYDLKWVKKRYLRRICLCQRSYRYNNVDEYIHVILLSLLIDSIGAGPGRRIEWWPVAFWNLSTISVGPLEPVLDSGGGYNSSTTSSIILSSRVNLLSSWNGLEPLYTDMIQSCFSPEFGIPTRIPSLFPFFFLSLDRLQSFRSNDWSREARFYLVSRLKISKWRNNLRYDCESKPTISINIKPSVFICGAKVWILSSALIIVISYSFSTHETNFIPLKSWSRLINDWQRINESVVTVWQFEKRFRFAQELGRDSSLVPRNSNIQLDILSLSLSVYHFNSCTSCRLIKYHLTLFTRLLIFQPTKWSKIEQRSVWSSILLL